MNNDYRKNASGLYDPTAYEAITHVDREAAESDVRFYKLLHTIFHICELAGFNVQGRLTLKDQVTGKIYK